MQALSDLQYPFTFNTTTIKYDFSFGLWDGDYDLPSGIETEFTSKSELGAALKSYFAAAASAWGNYSVFSISQAGISDTPNVHVYDTNAVSISGNAGIVGYFVSPTQTTAEGPPPSSTYLRAEVALDSSGSVYSPGQSAYWTVLHELGHVLGLKDPTNPSNYNTDMTVMSHNIAGGGTRFAATPMAYDIAALENMYGANSVNTGNDTYGAGWFTGIERALTIQDTGGIDTFDVSSLAGNHRINLNQAIDGSDQWAVTDSVADGAASIINGVEYVYIARGSQIENAIGGAGNDTLIGNDLANVLAGGSGSDVLRGGAGYDTYIMRHGETGTDQIIDSDGVGEIQVNGRALTGDAIYNQGATSWTMGHYTLARTGTGGEDLTFTSGFTGDPSFIVKNFTNGDLGITLVQPEQLASSPATPSGGAGVIYSSTVPSGSYTGTAADDSIAFPFGSATISGGAGNDTLSASYGGSIDGGDGDDIIVGGFNTAYGGSGNDAFTANIFAYVEGGSGDDTVYGGSTIIGGSGNDLISTGITGISNTISGDIQGGDGNDHITLIINSSPNVVFSVSGGNDADWIVVSGDSLSVSGDDGDDYIHAYSATNSSITGGDGNDTILASWENNTVSGGAGFDTFYASGNVDISGEVEGSRVYWGGGGTATGSSGNDIFIVNGLNAVIYAAGGHDFATGANGNDTIAGGGGNDSISGGEGNDSLSGDAGDDIIYGDAGNDYIEGGNNNDKLYGGTGLDTIWGGDGNDFIDGGADNDSLVGGNGTDTLIGGDGQDALYGGDGDDRLEGGAGDDYIEGGDGNDFIIGGAGSDYIDGGAGIDTVSYENSSAWVNVDLANNSNWNGDAAWDSIVNVENIIGSAYGDNLIGTNGGNIIAGGNGNDSIYGLDGDDTIYGGAGDDYIEAGDGNDLIIGGAGSDYIDGGAGIDTVSYADSSAWVNVDLGGNSHWNGDAAWDNIVNVENIIGSAHGDQLTGNSVANVLTGGAGNDTLTGGAGDDTFYFAAGHGLDVITDFAGVGSAGGDVIHLHQLGYTAFDGTLTANISYDFPNSIATITTSGGTITVHGVTTAFVAGDFAFS